MSENLPKEDLAQPSEALDAWIKVQLQHAVHRLGELGVVQSLVVEAKPAWVLPFSLLIGQIREKERLVGFDWFIAGEAPITYADAAVAKTPREAARHFALQWQLKAARQGELGEELASKAEALYDLVEKEELWLR